MPRIMTNRYVRSDNPYQQGMDNVCKAFEAVQGVTCVMRAVTRGSHSGTQPKC